MATGLVSGCYSQNPAAKSQYNTVHDLTCLMQTPVQPGDVLYQACPPQVNQFRVDAVLFRDQCNVWMAAKHVQVFDDLTGNSGTGVNAVLGRQVKQSGLQAIQVV